MRTLSHTEVEELLHEMSPKVDSSLQEALKAHLSGCKQCTSYAQSLAELQPRLTTALRNQVRFVYGSPNVDSHPMLVALQRSKSQKQIIQLIGAVMSLLLVVTVGVFLWQLLGSSNWAAMPKGSLIAFESARDNNSEIYLMTTDGKNAINLTQNMAKDTNPVWSPDGTRIAFISDRSGAPQIYVLQINNSSQIVQLTNESGPSGWADLAWSPDGTHLAVTRLFAHGTYDEALIYIMKSDGTDAPRPLLPNVHGSGAHWSADGQFIAFQGFVDGVPMIAIVNVSTKEMTVMNLPGHQPDRYYWLDGLDWSPMGLELVYLTSGPWIGQRPNSTFSFSESHTYLQRSNLAGGAQNLLTFSPSPNGIRGAVWSPDGKYILFISDPLSNGCWNIYLQPTDGGSLIHLQGICHLMRTAMPSWSPNGDWLVFTSSNGDAVGVYKLNVVQALENSDQVTAVPLTTQASGQNLNPVWQPSRP